jgi:hypothetical protein
MRGICTLQFILSQVDTIKLAFEYKQLAKKEKGRVRRQIFAKDHSDVIPAECDHETRLELIREHREDQYKLFKHTFDKEMVKKYNLLRAYRSVSTYPHHANYVPDHILARTDGADQLHMGPRREEDC